jgi:hypothetical protein
MENERAQYWQKLGLASNGARLELRGVLAWELIKHWALISGTPALTEDSAGRAKIELMPPDQIVERVFAIADRFVDKVTERKEIKETWDSAEVAAEEGRMARIRLDQEFRKPVGEVNTIK